MSAQGEVRRLRRLAVLQQQLEDRALTSSRVAAAAAVAAGQRLQRARDARDGMAQSAGPSAPAALAGAAHWRGLLAQAVDSANAGVAEADAAAHSAAQDHARQQKRRERLDERLATACRASEQEMSG